MNDATREQTLTTCKEHNTINLFNDVMEWRRIYWDYVNERQWNRSLHMYWFLMDEKRNIMNTKDIGGNKNRIIRVVLESNVKEPELNNEIC